MKQVIIMLYTTDVFLISFMVSNSEVISEFCKRSKFFFHHFSILSIIFAHDINQLCNSAFFIILLIKCLNAFKCIPNFFRCRVYPRFFIVLKRLFNEFIKLMIIYLKIHQIV